RELAHAFSFQSQRFRRPLSNGLRSLSATMAPRCARNRALAMPLRAAPITKAFLPASFIESATETQRHREEQTRKIRLGSFRFLFFHPLCLCISMVIHRNFRVERLSKANRIAR